METINDIFALKIKSREPIIRFSLDLYIYSILMHDD
jgi:hypothetical protein